MQQDRLGTALDDLFDVLLLQDGLAVDDDVVTLDGDHLARILVDEILDPRREHARGQHPADGLFQIGLGDLHLVGEIEYFEDLLIRLETDGPQKGRDGQLLLAVDVGVHHVVDVRGELYPRPLERNDSGGVEFGAVGVYALPEEYARRTV